MQENNTKPITDCYGNELAFVDWCFYKNGLAKIVRLTDSRVGIFVTIPDMDSFLVCSRFYTCSSTLVKIAQNKSELPKLLLDKAEAIEKREKNHEDWKKSSMANRKKRKKICQIQILN